MCKCALHNIVVITEQEKQISELSTQVRGLESGLNEKDEELRKIEKEKNDAI